jgi:hypothetical protein
MTSTPVRLPVISVFVFCIILEFYAAEANRSNAWLLCLFGTKQPSNRGQICIMYAFSCESSRAGLLCEFTKKYWRKLCRLSVFLRRIASWNICSRRSLFKPQKTRPRAFFLDKFIAFLISGFMGQLIGNAESGPDSPLSRLGSFAYINLNINPLVCAASLMLSTMIINVNHFFNRNRKKTSLRLSPMCRISAVFYLYLYSK